MCWCVVFRQGLVVATINWRAMEYYCSTKRSYSKGPQGYTSLHYLTETGKIVVLPVRTT